MPRIGLRRSSLPWIALAVSLVLSQPASATPYLADYAPSAEPASTGTRSTFEPLPPTKLLDTRQSSAIGAGLSRTVQVTGMAGVPADATAVTLNITVVTPPAAGYLIVYPNGAPRPPVASITFQAKQTLANLAAVKVGTLGRIVVFNSTGAARHVLLDVTGYYRSHAHDDRYLTKADAQGRTAPNAFNCAAGTVLRSVAADGTPTCEALPDAGTSYEIGSGLKLDGTTLSAEQGRSAAGAFACSLGSYLQAVAADGAPTCAPDKDTDTDTDTTYTAGPGLVLDGTTFAAEQGRSAPNAFFCASGTYLRAVSATGAPTCAADAGVEFTTGLGLLLSNGVLSAEQGRGAKDAFTCPEGWYLRVVDADGAPTCSEDVDTDTDTTYAPGFGLFLNGNVFSAQQGRSATNAMTCGLGLYLQVIAQDGAPTCAADKDTNTTYTAGFGLTLTGTTFSAQQGRSAPAAMTCGQNTFLRAIAPDGAPTCGVDQNTAYTAGAGLSLANGELSAKHGTTLVPVAGDQTPAANGTALRAAMSAITDASATKPYVISLAPGTYELGTSLTLKANVALVGAGRTATILTGNFPSQSGGLVNLGANTALERLTVKNVTNTTNNWAMAVMASGTISGRVNDVSATAEGGLENYGLLVFNGAQVFAQGSQFVGKSATALGVGIYSVASAFVRASDVEAVSLAPTGYALHAYNASTIEFVNGFSNGQARKGTPDSVVKLANTRLDGGSFGGVQCVNVFSTAWTEVTCV
ncbi:MAG TPA: hypothetical protein VGX28_11445 [Frankiaceae bacterium]|jgi:hypothetical protein|nr:hypothetical protein [Frankiaceae bacterium]